MMLGMYLKEDQNKEDFVRFVTYRVRSRIVNNYKKLLYEPIINKLNTSNLIETEDKLNSTQIFNSALKNMIYKNVDANRWIIEIDQNVIYKDTGIKLINIIKLFEYGSSTFKPVPLIRESFNYYEQRIPYLYKEYELMEVR